ncbi:tryptophan synthase subunit beta [Candidatus Hecatella orcuttiae]|uniref:tryptophan synthase subunit beta n=1 Tax=Candidatus Hecatella orcuttiae TaxID=1935119 RepID=UPI002867EE8C|nr:tryptophan synthase subunit beta [Candidatus Hecatella orcuttiae]
MKKTSLSYYGRYPDEKGKFGRYGGIFAPEILMPALEELHEAFLRHHRDPGFQGELGRYLRDYAGRPTPLYYAQRLSWRLGCKVYLKREDLTHGGAHKLNNTLGQALLALRMGKKRLIAETGAGQHGLATAMAGAVLGLKTEVYMGEEDVERQRHNVYRMELLGAEVHPVKSGSRTLKDAINEAFRDWIAHVGDTHYVVGSVVGPHPYPLLVREFQRVIGKEIRQQVLEKEGRLPSLLVACIGGGSNALGAFYDFLEDPSVQLHGVEAGGQGLRTGRHSASLAAGSLGVLHGAYTRILQDEYGQIETSHSISAGLDYPGVGPELAFLQETGRLKVYTATDAEAVEAFHMLAKLEGILPALEPCHALAHLAKISRRLPPDSIVVLNLSGRGDKDLGVVQKFMEDRK